MTFRTYVVVIKLLNQYESSDFKRATYIDKMRSTTPRDQRPDQTAFMPAYILKMHASTWPMWKKKKLQTCGPHVEFTAHLPR